MKLPKGFRELGNGVLFAPAVGSPPQAPEGYEQMPGSKWHFIPIITCGCREKRKQKTCCGLREIYYCNKFEKVILYIDCKDCPERNNPNACS
jgi:hypothetical protein